MEDKFSNTHATLEVSSYETMMLTMLTACYNL